MSTFRALIVHQIYIVKSGLIRCDDSKRGDCICGTSSDLCRCERWHTTSIVKSKISARGEILRVPFNESMRDLIPRGERAAPIIKTSLYADDCAIMQIIARALTRFYGTFSPAAAGRLGAIGAAGGSLHNYADSPPSLIPKTSGRHLPRIISRFCSRRRLDDHRDLTSSFPIWLSKRQRHPTPAQSIQRFELGGTLSHLTRRRAVFI